jgi:hypothetical protein
MKHLTLAVAAITASLALGSPAFANDEHHAEKTAAAKRADGQSIQTIKGMQDNVKKMRTQLDRIAKATTDGEKQKALAEQMHTMQNSMMMAHSMEVGMEMDCPMMGKGMSMGKMEDSASPSVSSSAPSDRMQQMEKRMDMMEQMMKHQDGGATQMPMK